MKIQIVTEKEPWEFYLSTLTEEETAKMTPLELLENYHVFLYNRGNAEGTCFICERKFRPRKTETPPPPKDKKGKKLDV